MKAVIVDLLKGQAAALCEDGRVIRLPDAGYDLGQQIQVHERARRRPALLRRLSAAAAAAALLLAVGGTAYALPYGVVSLDAAPSIEYTINCFDYVLSVQGVNEDGKALLAGMDRKKLVNRRIGDALSASLAQMEAEDLLGGEASGLLISAGTRGGRHAEHLLAGLEDDLCRGRGLEVRALSVSREEIDAAHEAGMSAGRWHALGKLCDGGEAPEGWADRPVDEILYALEHGQTKPGGDGDRAGQGNAGKGGGLRERQGRGGENDGGGDPSAENDPAQPPGEEGLRFGGGRGPAGSGTPPADFPAADGRGDMPGDAHSGPGGGRQ